MSTRTETIIFSSTEVLTGTVPTSIVASYTDPNGVVLAQTDAFAPVAQTTGTPPVPVLNPDGTPQMGQTLTPYVNAALGNYTATFTEVDQNGATIGTVLADKWAFGIAVLAPASVSGVTTA